MRLDILTDAERAQIETCCHCDPFAAEVWRQVQRILESRRFGRVQQRAKDFLIHIVAKTLLGQADQIKETTIAMAVFDESADYNPAETSKVRVAGIDLRQRLDAYAEREGQHDIIQILIPQGTYVPEIHDRRVAVEITEFENWHPHGQQRYLCVAITAEIAYQLGQAGFRAGLAETFHIDSSRHRYTLRGSVESRGVRLRINVSLADPTADAIICSYSVDGARDDVLKLTRELADALLAALAQERHRQKVPPVTSRKGT